MQVVSVTMLIHHNHRDVCNSTEINEGINFLSDCSRGDTGNNQLDNCNAYEQEPSDKKL